MPNRKRLRPRVTMVLVLATVEAQGGGKAAAEQSRRGNRNSTQRRLDRLRQQTKQTA
jgi:hypothetical protein